MLPFYVVNLFVSFIVKRVTSECGINVLPVNRVVFITMPFVSYIVEGIEV